MSTSPDTSQNDSACSPLAQLQPVLQSTDSPLLLPPMSSPKNHHKNTQDNEPSTPPTSGWDNDFFSFSTPTPKPPPRLAPMVSSSSSSPARTRLALRDPPTPLIIPGVGSNGHAGTGITTSTTNIHSQGARPSHDHQPDHHTVRPPPRLGVAAHPHLGRGLAAHLAHHRTQSYSQFHSNTLGSDLFGRSSDAGGPTSALPPSVHPPIPSALDGAASSQSRAAAPSVTVETTPALPVDPTHPTSNQATGGERSEGGNAAEGRAGRQTLSSSSALSCITTSTIRPHTLTSTASPAATRSASPSLTPSSSQSNLFSNLPSPLPHANLTTSFRDGSPDSKQRLFNSWIASHPPIKPLAESSPPSSPSTGTVAAERGVTSSDERSSATSAATAMDGSFAHDPLVDVSQSSTPSSSHLTSGGSDRKNSVASIVTHGATFSTTAPISSSSASSSSSTSHPGKIYPGLKNTVGPYKLIHGIGRGSFSEVKLAVDTRTGEQVAIKVMSRAVVQSSDRLGVSVRRESELLQSIHHINIIGFRGLVETTIQTCIVLDYAPGGELFEYVINNRVSASELDLQCIFSQIVDVLVPRAATPLRPIIKLTDFGLARVIEEHSPLLTTRCGSEDYAAPEIILGQPYDGREADIWSLGVMLYALLVGYLPFNQDASMSRKTFLHMIVTADFGFPGERILLHPRKESPHPSAAGTTAGTRRVTSHSSLKNEILREAEAAFNPSTTVTSAAIPKTTATATTTSAATNTTDDDSKTLDGSESPAESLTTKTAAASIASTTTTADSSSKGRIVPAMKGVSLVSDEAKQVVRRLLQTVGSKRPRARDLKHDPWVVTGHTAMWEQ
ncbi:hypothetical protein BGW41_006237 [Actinomortierella wolfii]|nr:hypothetical protein BGW41_006237 [Actinomortierella wolfii]